MKAYEIEVKFTIKKTYTVAASNEDEAIEKLAESGIVTSACTGPNEDYNEDYDVRRLVDIKYPDVE
jgi:hypothetical protein